MNTDLSGQKFGKWLVLEKTEHRTKDRNILYLCQCECGTIREVSSSALRRGKSKSCGCYRTPAINLIGKKFDRLTVLQRDESKIGRGEIFWLCQCECGTICSRSTYNLQDTAHLHSCGCYTLEQVSKINPGKALMNQHFGKLTVLEECNERKPHGDKIWKCQCECGNIIYTTSARLLSGESISCGCIAHHSIGELHIQEILDRNRIEYKREYSIPELNYKRFDFAIIQNNQPIRFIEFDGIQHYEASSQFNMGNDTLFTVQQRDKIKNEYAFSHNIPLVRIPYWERDKITLEMLLGDEYLVKQ